MLLVLMVGFPTLVALLIQAGAGDSSLIHAPTGAELTRILLRWFHFLAGITWIGILYFFNLVNVNFMKALDAPTKGKVVPELMPRALWWFRWGAVVTVLVGVAYYAMYMLGSDARNAGLSAWGAFAKWLGFVVIFWAVIYGLLQPVSGTLNKGAVLAVLIAIDVLVLAAVIIRVFNVPTPTGPAFSNKSLSIGIGGGLGVIMLLNVWGIIWPAQKRIIAWTKENAEKGTAMPPESAKLARRAFLASRTNAWLSLPMLFFMAASHGDYIWFGPK
ncbi:MAG: urate hydroxylase PuuD [Acidobacteria bacterium]|nr:urate hydroxylase PuuD [Acidobacteriota bacterium]